MIHQAVFVIETENAEIMYHAIQPEEGDEGNERSHGICSISADNLLTVTVEANDLSALRASLNTWLRLIQVSSEVIDRAKT